MKRRVLGFTLGAVLGVGAAYAMRRWRNNQNKSMSLAAAVPEKPPVVETPSDVPQRTKYSVRRTGPRPQGIMEADGDASATNVKITRSTEPRAATETDAAATSPRSETFEPDITQAEFEPATIESVSTEEKSEPASVAKKAESNKGSTIRVSRKKKEQPPADFLPIVGIGEVFNQRLQESGITTYAALAAISSEELSQKIDVAQERIDRDKWQEQAAQLAEEEAGKTSEESDEAAEDNN